MSTPSSSRRPSETQHTPVGSSSQPEDSGHTQSLEVDNSTPNDRPYIKHEEITCNPTARYSLRLQKTLPICTINDSSELRILTGKEKISKSMGLYKHTPILPNFKELPKLHPSQIPEILTQIHNEKRDCYDVTDGQNYPALEKFVRDVQEYGYFWPSVTS